MKLTMGSLFDGSGGFPLAGTLGGIETLWTSEIEPFPIRVTTKRFPNAKHYGDISKLKGAELEPVDIITGGSPCQDLSISGKRKGMKRHCPNCGYETEAQDEETMCPLCDTELKYTRSGLFMEQIRVIKEMREATNGKYPRFMLWENVPGAFSSNKGQDFKAVLEETIGVKREISLPRPPKDKWQNAGCIVGDGYSVAWRVVDAQYCGVPQRRRRIVLIADFGGECAGEILFERYGLRGNFAQSQDERERTAGDTADSFGAADSENEHGDRCVTFDGANVTSPYNAQNPKFGDPCHTLNTDSRNYVVIKTQGATYRANGFDRYNQSLTDETAPTLKCPIGGDNVQCVVIENHPVDSRVNIDDSGRCQTLTSRMGTGGGNVPLVMEKKANSLNNDQTIFCLQGSMIGREDKNGPQGEGINEDVSFTLNTTDRHAVAKPIAFEPGIAKREGGENRFCEDVSPTIRANMGDNQTSVVYAIDRETFNCGQRFARNLGISEGDVMPTLNAQGPGAVCYNICSYASNSMKSSNPHSGIYQADKTRTLDLNGGNPTCNQGGTMIVEPIYCSSKASFFTRAEKELANTLVATDYKDAPIANDKVGQEYIVRRLTPLECCRLQGFPDNWTDSLETPEPTEEDIAFWRDVFETHSQIVNGKPSTKTDKQIIKWLKDPYSDSALYKMWGNGIALPCMARFLCRIPLQVQMEQLDVDDLLD